MIYKPTDLSPSAQTFDVKDTPIFFECKIDTSNVKAEGFTIKVLNSENDVVFSSIPEGESLKIEYISLIDELNKYVSEERFKKYTVGYNLLNSGYNGTYLKFPFSLSLNSININNNINNKYKTLRNTQVFYSEKNPNGEESSAKSGSGMYRYITYAAEWNESNIYYVGDIVKTTDNTGIVTYYYSKKTNTGNKPAVGEDGPWEKVLYMPVEIYNGKEYKWSVTLYQLENIGSDRAPKWVLPQNPLLLDMPLTIGTVLGSCDTRIQSVLSEDIYADYFIQPVFINGLTFNRSFPFDWRYELDESGDAIRRQSEDTKTNRALIKAYDQTYGYIYPSDGQQGFPGNTISKDRVNAFRIYKFGNNVENLNAYQQVAYVCETPIDKFGGSDDPQNASWKWVDSYANPGESYGEMIYFSLVEQNGLYSDVPGMNGFALKGGERVVLNAQATQASYDGIGNYIGSPYNGIYYPEFSSIKLLEYSDIKMYNPGERVYFQDKVYESKGIVKGKDPNAGIYWRQVSFDTLKNGWADVDEYSEETEYKQGQCVFKTSNNINERRKIYKCKKNITISKPKDSPQFDKDSWEEINVKDWKYGTSYNKGDIISYFGIHVKAKENLIANFPPLDSPYFENINVKTLINGETYNKDDYVWYTNLYVSYYQCTGITYKQDPSDTTHWRLTDNDATYQIVVRWNRAPDADSWGELKNKVVLVTSSQSPYYGKNIQIKSTSENSDAYGVINQTPFKFVEEEPIEIYNNKIKPYDSTHQYKYGDVVSFVSPSSTNGEWNASDSYAPGQIVFKEINKEVVYYICTKRIYGKFYICNKSSSAGIKPDSTEGLDVWKDVSITKYRKEYGYIQGQCVENEGKYYECIKDITSTNISIDNVEYWKNITIGVFDDSKVYNVGEYVSYNAVSGAVTLNDTVYWAQYKKNNYFVCISNVPITNIEPTINTYWYENPYLNNTGLIFYNQQLEENNELNDQSGYLYIRHFDGITKSMGLFKNTATNQQYYFDIADYNPEYNFVEYKKIKLFDTYEPYRAGDNKPEELNPKEIKGDIGWNIDSTKYQIKTFFRESDENAFYFYTTPVVTLHYENSNGVNFIEDRVLTEKYYVDYIENVPAHIDGKVYNIGDVYWKEKDGSKAYYQVDDKYVAKDVTDEWTDPANTTTDYNQCFSYNKDDIVSYDNKRDFLLYKSDQSYKYGDKVKYNGKYYMSTVDNPGTPPSNWQEVIFDDGVETTVTYVAIANVPVGKEYAPGQDNIGLYWQQYIGVLFENEGYVPAAHYYNNVKYAVGTNIIYKGLYFYVNKENESFEPRDDVRNEYGTKIWEKYTSKNDIDVYEDGAKEWFNGVLKKYDKPNNTWSEYTGEHEGNNYDKGLMVNNDNPPTLRTTFDAKNVYQKTSRTFYNGYCYVVVADTALHLPTFNKASSDSDYFIRLSKGKPLNYPESAIKSYKYTNQTSGEETTNNKRKYLMGDIALSKANSDDGLPDRYWVKFNNTSTEDVNNFIPNQTYWQTYYGPIFKKSDSETGYDETVDYEYNDIILDNESGLYFVQKNINIKGKGPLSPSGQKAWSVNSEYKIGDIVVYNNVIYICKSNGVSGSRPSVNSEFWDVYPWQLYIPEITERTLRVSATYDQQQYIQWKSAQWFLFDDRGENIKEKSNVFYDGDLSYTFHGLDGRDEATGADRYFIVRLILETYNGYRLTIDQTIEVMFSITEIKSEGLIDIAFDCDTASVVTTITKESGFIVPSDIAEYANIPQGSDIGTAGEMSLSGQMKYQKVSTSIEDASQISTAGPILSAAERFVQQINYTIDTDKFCGTLIGLQSFSGPTNADPENLTAQSKKVGDFNIFIPEFLQEISGTSLYPDDEVLKERRYIKLSKNRNYMKWSASQAGTPYDGGVTIAVIDGDDTIITTIEEGNLAEKDESGKNYLLGYKYHETIPLWQKKEFKAPENTNVLDVSYEQTIEHNGQEALDSKYLNVTLNYSIYTTKLDEIKKNIGEQDFHTIKQPIVKQTAFNNSDNPEYKGTTYSTAEFIQNGNNEAGGEETLKTSIRVRSNTSTMWSDYVFRVPFGTIVGANADQETLYTIKNVWDTVGWRWQEDEDGGSVWSDADYITEYNGYQTQIGSISLNGEEIERIDFNDESITIQDQRSKTFFKPQEGQEQLFNERRFLKGKKFIFDVDLTMDADGYITPTSIEDLSPGADGFLKIVAYTGDTNNTNK